MPDTYAPSARAEYETGDGFIVVSRKLANVIQPYRYRYDLDWFATADDAHQHYTDIENGEHHGWEVVAILPSRGGVPLGSKRLPI
jgi:hypothetical protein